MAKTQTKQSPNKNAPAQSGNAVVHNRLRKEKKPSTDSKYLARQATYYAHQETILANKRQYNKDVKEGKRVPVRKASNNPTKSTPSKKKEPKIQLTPEKKAELRRAQKRAHYADNSEAILKYQFDRRQKKLAEEKKIKAQQAIDAFNKLNGW